MTKYTIFRGALSVGECERLSTLPPIKHHSDDDGHGGDGVKDYRVDWLSERLTPIVQGAVKGGYVDPMVKVYRLGVGEGVGQHIDDDYVVDGRLARWSVLCYLSDKHAGGVTRFADGDAPHCGRGDVLVFPHALLHEGTPVTAGERVVLKTDIIGLNNDYWL